MYLEFSDTPEWLDLPEEYQILISQGLVNFDPWILMPRESVIKRMLKLHERFPGRKLFPFAKREDCDDLACWEEANGIVVIHDFASPGFEGGQESYSFWDWFRKVVEEMIEYNC